MLSTLNGYDGPVLGGKIVLASRWHHRISTDIDLLTDADRYQYRVANRMDQVLAALSRLVSESGQDTVEVEGGLLRVNVLEGFMALMTNPHPTVRDAYAEVADVAEYLLKARRKFSR